MRLRMVVLCLGFGLTTAPPARTQGPPPPTAEREAMKRFDNWIGTWKGTGWAMIGQGNRREFEITETVQSKVGGLALLVEGLGKGKDDAGKEFVAHNAMAVLSYDPKAKQHRFRYYTAQGMSGESELKMTEGGMEWGFRPAENGPLIRFTIKLDAKKWNETGEVSMDGGKTWLKFMEMNLEKQKEASSVRR
jgi:hypothetical protein